MLATLISLDFGGELEPGIKFDQIENWIRRCNKLLAGNPITPAREMLSGKGKMLSYPIHSFPIWDSCLLKHCHWHIELKVGNFISNINIDPVVTISTSFLLAWVYMINKDFDFVTRLQCNDGVEDEIVTLWRVNLSRLSAMMMIIMPMVMMMMIMMMMSRRRMLRCGAVNPC